jgi:hypothetical protein
MANKKKIIPFLNSPLNVFSTLAFPALFPFGTGDFQINRPRTFGVVPLSDAPKYIKLFINRIVSIINFIFQFRN